MSVNEEKKKFMMKHVFPSSECKIGVTTYGKEENHFGVPWRLYGNFMDFTYSVYLECMAPEYSDDWSIEIQTILNAFSKIAYSNVRRVFTLSPSRTRNDVLMFTRDETSDLPVEVNVQIMKMNGNFGLKKDRSFNESNKKYSDVVMKVKDEKFYVSKLLLAYHSTYFQSLLFGNFEESKQSEVEIKDIEPQDFQNYLELIHGESVVNDITVAGILKLGDFLDSKFAIKRCEEFLMNTSKKPMKEKLRFAIQYRLDGLKTKCMSEIKTIEDIRSIVPEVTTQVEDSIWKELLLKAVNLK